MGDFPELRQKAEVVLKTLEENPSERPIFVEFSGTPKSGKSTCIEIVAHFFRRVGFRVLAPTEGASKRTPYYLKDDWVAFNTWSASYALTHILEGLYSSDKYHLAILDRGLFDALAWFQLLLDRGQDEITPQECEQIHNFLLIEKWRSVIDHVFLFKADPATSLERENRFTLINEPGRAMNPQALGELNRAYYAVQERYKTEFRGFRTIDTSDSQQTTQQTTAAEVAGLILDRFNQG